MPGARNSIRIILALLSFAIYALAVISLHQDQRTRFDIESVCMATAASHIEYGTPLGKVYKSFRSAFVDSKLPQEQTLDLMRRKQLPATELLDENHDDNGIGCPIYATAAMSIFGTHVASLTDLFLLLLGISALTYIARFQDERMLFVPIMFFSLTLMLLTPMVSNVNTLGQCPIGGIRYFVIVGILPGAHLFFEICDSARKTVLQRRNALALIFQMALLTLAYYTRRSPVYFFIPAIIVVMITLLRNHRDPEIRGNILRTSAVAVIACALAAAVFIGIMPSAYVKDGRLTGEMWHRMFISLSAHPDWPFGNIHDVYHCTIPQGIVHNGGDQNGHCVWEAYGNNPHRPHNEVGEETYNAHYEVALREAMIYVASHYPRQTFETFFYYKSRVIPITLMSALQWSNDLALRRWAAVSAFVLLLFVISGASEFSMRRLGILLFLPPMYFVCALGPQFVAWVAMHTSGDLIFYMYAFFATAACLFLLMLLQTMQRLRERTRRKSRPTCLPPNC